MNLTASHQIKLVAIGDGAVGKTSLLQRQTQILTPSLKNEPFDAFYKPTIIENYNLQLKNQKTTLNISVWYCLKSNVQGHCWSRRV